MSGRDASLSLRGSDAPFAGRTATEKNALRDSTKGPKVRKGLERTFLLTSLSGHVKVSPILWNGDIPREKKSRNLIELEIGSQIKYA
jgi:hypothetical protein